MLIGGTIKTNFAYYSETENETFYIFMVSGEENMIPVIMSDKTFEINNNNVGKNILIKGKLKNFDKNDYEGRMIYVEPIEVEFVNQSVNEVQLVGKICKEPTSRTTPNGHNITNTILAVEGSEDCNEYIPCVAWGENANKLVEKQTGSEISINGLFQTRRYLKNGQYRTAYEVSILGMS